MNNDAKHSLEAEEPNKKGRRKHSGLRLVHEMEGVLEFSSCQLVIAAFACQNRENGRATRQGRFSAVSSKNSQMLQ